MDPLSYSSEVRRVYSSFFVYRNDIDIYTEDNQDSKEFYKVLLNKLLKDSHVKINDLTQLGPKSEVIRHCEDDNDTTRKKLYIVDGDIDLINDTNRVMPDLYVLDAYCIENFLIEEDSICFYLYTQTGTLTMESISQSVNYENWINEYIHALINLFFHFAITNKILSRFTLFNADKYFIRGKFKIDLVNAEIESCKREILQAISTSEYESELNNLKRRWPVNKETFLRIISGKSYLIPIVLFKMCEIIKKGYKPSLESAKMNLLLNCSLTSLKNLKLAIESRVPKNES
ncbi:DUF4435 domain-containing protein [Arsenicibacter rosenii]|uniref:DUF4435 domain-containing protein n=1 Tax=Arsenicibacter rosenii TaxID=1750698 RepID=A0A1S2VCY6_9BACT|nr:DUF4435 domain-containing protein [Arsenicibacter rosenii]OIN56096.1 hypothetical protein BLX24_26350 [Arsenicibacter rosenii]